MKTIQKRWLPLFLLAALTFLFPACEGNKSPVDEVSSGEDTDIRTIQECNGGISMRGQYTKGHPYIRLCGGYVYGELDQTYPGYTSDPIFISIDIVNVGKVNSLTQIKEIPSTGYSDKAEIKVGYGYVFKVSYKTQHPEKNYTYYCRLYIKEYLNYGAVSGYKYAFQQDWNPLYN